MRWVPALALLAAACEPGIKPTATIAAPDSADQVHFGMSHYVTNMGVQRAQVRADTAYFYSPSQTAELRNVDITFYDVRGAQTSTLTSREGTYHWRGGDMEARGNVDRKSTRLNSSHDQISYAVFCLKKKKQETSTM